MPDAATSLFTFLAEAWHPAYLNALLVAAFLQLVLQRARPPQPHLLRNTLIFTGLCGLLVVATGVSAWLGYRETAPLLDGLATLILGILVIRLAGLTLFRVLLPQLKLQPPRILEDILIVVAYIVWGLVRLRYAGLDLGSLVATSAVITAILAFAMQDTLGNILGGIALQLDDSIHIGDWIKVDEVSGRVVEVHWRHTAVRTRNGEIVVLPNSLLMKSKFTIVSRDDTPQWRRWVPFYIGLEVPPQRVIAAVEKAVRDAAIPLVSRDPAPNCVLLEFKDGFGSYALRYWLTDAQADDPTDSAVRLHVYAALQREGLRFDPPALDVRLTNQSDELASRVRERELALRRKTLRRVELFDQLSDEEIAHLAESLTYAQFVRGDVITRQGAVAHWLYVLIQGEADVWYEAEGMPRRHLTTLAAGKVFGERGLMTGEPRRATVTARTDAECYRIDKRSFEKVMQSRPELAEAFAHILTERDKQLVAVKQERIAVDHDQQQARLLENIRRFFRLDHA
ncbi:MAG TPA: mechanosensitive ion channel family protein [Moraxellaceae bacterium]|nr:mechanosensitive ion channel family protein [Moraxellaceae bacterium]